MEEQDFRIEMKNRSAVGDIAPDLQQMPVRSDAVALVSSSYGKSHWMCSECDTLPDCWSRETSDSHKTV